MRDYGGNFTFGRFATVIATGNAVKCGGKQVANERSGNKKPLIFRGFR